MVAEGGDPRVKPTAVPSFEEAAGIVIDIHAQGWRNPKTARQGQSSLDPYAMPFSGAKSVAQITTADAMACLLPIWTTENEMASKIRQRIGSVMRWAVTQGYRTDHQTGKALNQYQGGMCISGS